MLSKEKKQSQRISIYFDCFFWPWC